MKPTQSRTYAVRCQSGQMGSRYRLRSAYGSLEDFTNYSDMYGLAARLGYAGPDEAWAANPVVEGSVNPGDYRKVRD